MNKIGKKVVTQQMIADAAGVHLSTVSLALRNAARIPDKTRRHIQAVADRLGYSPNPLVSLLMSRVRRRNAGYRGTLAFVHSAPEGTPKLATHQHRNFLSGAKLRAAELGYNVDEFHLPDKPRRVKQFVVMLQTRGIHGLIIEHIPGVSCPERRLPFDVGQFAVVSLGVPLASPTLHYVANDQYMRAVLASKNLLEMGYRRIGLVIDETFDQLMAHRCSAGFWAVQQYTEGVEVLPICRMAKDDSKNLKQWLRKHRPTGVLGTSTRALDGLLAAGLEVPEDVGWAHLDWLPEHKPAAGVYGNSEDTGAAAVELVVSQLHRGEAGPPQHAMNYLVAGTWMPGKSVCKVGPSINLDATFFGHVTSV